ncbi:MAG: hypothetical protein U0165_02000 [Polyangiaceae bacterium]
MANIQSELDRIAREFILGVVDALAGASLAEIAHFASENRTASRPKGIATRGPRAKTADTTPATRGAASSSTAPARSSRRGRRSSDEVAEITKRIVAYVNSAGEKVAVSQIAKALHLDISDVTRPIFLAVEEGLIKKEGEKRMTRYFPA